MAGEGVLKRWRTDIFMAQMFQQLQFPVRSLGQHRRTERFHDLFDGDRLRSQLVLCGTVVLRGVACQPTMPNEGHQGRAVQSEGFSAIPDQSKRPHSHRLQVGVPIDKATD